MTRWHQLCVAEHSTAERGTECEYSWRHYSSDTAQRTLLASLYPWKLVSSAEVPYRYDRPRREARCRARGSAGARCAVAGAFSWIRRGRSWFVAAHNMVVSEVLVLVVASVALCLLALPESRPGLVANAVILILWLIVSRIEG